jgi:PEP-CTERM motif
MNGIARTPRRSYASCHCWFGFTLLAIAFLLASRVEAAAIVHASRIEKKEMAESGSSWSEYLLGGPRVWDHVPHPPVTEAVKHEIRKALKTDPGGTALIVQFLLNKQSLDPARFDHYHPNLVRPLSKFETSSSPTITTGAQVLGPGSSTTTLPTEAQTTGSSAPPTEAQTTGSPSAQNVPEPETLLLAIGMAGWAVWWRRRLN